MRVSVGHSGMPEAASRSITSSVMRSPCMIQSTPALTAKSTASEPRAWMVTDRPNWWAISAMAAISSRRNAVHSPVAVSPILMKSTPFLICTRTSARISSMVLATVPMLLSGTPTDVG